MLAGQREYGSCGDGDPSGLKEVRVSLSIAVTGGCFGQPNPVVEVEVDGLSVRHLEGQ
jgi:hypothetical protein